MNLRELLTEHLPQMPEAISGIVMALLLALIPALLVVAAVVTPVGLLGVYAERRLSGKIQDRSGPNRVGISIGPIKHHLWGLGQSVADGLKLLGKEDFVPPGGEKVLFLIAPLIVFGGSLALFAVLPFGPNLVGADPNVGIFYVLSIGALEVIGVLMAGWASNNKWSLIGAMREVAQVGSYEIPMGIAALCPVLMTGSLRLSEIISRQAAEPVIWGVHIPIPGELFLGWNVFAAFPFNIITFVIFYICCLANLKRAPFDLPECESELVAGFLTEYSGMRWGLFFLGEYAAMFALSGIGATLFLGGWTGPVHYLAVHGFGAAPGGIGDIVGGAIEFTWKTSLLFILMIWVRWTLPRMRLDQVMRLCYKYLVPAAMVCMLATAAAALLG
ncbi:MAG: NADH-quinone oxidoreductase subunit H [Planctomycetes bacterium]|nr:NADH-quinone oxidoreductase subunit H [Planctomycetota bacterium]